MRETTRTTATALTAALGQWRVWLAFLYSVPIAVLGGLIGLGGAEFRLPVLAGPLRYPVRRAVPLNLAVSLVTLTVSLLMRGRTLSLDPVVPFYSAIVAMIAGAIVTAFIGTALVGLLSNEQLERIILVLLVTIGGALIVEGFLPREVVGLVPRIALWHISVGVCFGLAIGLVSSLLGVAGGELIIPTMIFVFGADIKTAGSASLLISLPAVVVGVIRYARRGAFRERRDFMETIIPMAIGSAIGAILGGSLVGLFPSPILKIGLGIILMVSAIRIFRHTRSGSTR